MAVVVNDHDIVFGLLRAEQLAGDPDRTAEQAMRPGPSTFRPHVPIEEMAEYMIEHELESCPITTSQGMLMGVLFREDAAVAALEEHRPHSHSG